MESQPVQSFTYPHHNPYTQQTTDRPVGHQLLKNAYHDIRVCEYPGADMMRTELQLQQALPYSDGAGTLQPGPVRMVVPTLRPR